MTAYDWLGTRRPRGERRIQMSRGTRESRSWNLIGDDYSPTRSIMHDIPGTVSCVVFLLLFFFAKARAIRFCRPFIHRIDLFQLIPPQTAVGRIYRSPFITDFEGLRSLCMRQIGIIIILLCLCSQKFIKRSCRHTRSVGLDGPVMTSTSSRLSLSSRRKETPTKMLYISRPCVTR